MAKKGILGLFSQKKTSGSPKERARRHGLVLLGEHLSLLAGKEHILLPLTWLPHPNPQAKPPVPDRKSLGPLPLPLPRHKRIVSTVEETLMGPDDSWDDLQSEIVPLALVAEDVVISFDPKRSLTLPSLLPLTMPMTPTTPASSRMGTGIADDDRLPQTVTSFLDPPRMPSLTSSSPKLPTVLESPLDEDDAGAITVSPVIPRRHLARGQMPLRRLSLRSPEVNTGTTASPAASPKPTAIGSLSQRYAGGVVPPTSLLPAAKAPSTLTKDPSPTSTASLELLPPHDLHPSAENLDGISDFDITSRHVETYQSAAKPQMVEVPRSPTIDQSDLAGVSNIEVVDVGMGFGSESDDSGVIKPQTVSVPPELPRDLPLASLMALDLYREAYMQLMEKYNLTVERHRKEVALLQSLLEQEREKSKHLMRVMTSRGLGSSPLPRDKVRSKFIVPLEIVRLPELGTSDESLDPQGVHECLTLTPLDVTLSEETDNLDKRTTAYFTARLGLSKTDLADTDVQEPATDVAKADPKAPALAQSVELVHMQLVLNQPYEEEDDEVLLVDDIFDFDVTAAVAFEELDSNMTTPEACTTDKF